MTCLFMLVDVGEDLSRAGTCGGDTCAGRSWMISAFAHVGVYMSLITIE